MKEGKSPAVIIGIGEMGGVFARGFLRAGYPVYPVTREDPPAHVAGVVPDPTLVLLAVAEKDFREALATVPDPWRDRTALLQNELLPRDWRSLGHEPTVISVWFEKKKGQDAKIIIPSPVYGPKADLLARILAEVEIPARVVSDPDEMLFELVRKNLYILAGNIAGLKVGGTVGELRSRHGALLRDLVGEALQIQEWLVGRKLPAERLLEGLLEAFAGDPDHRCAGRSAPARLIRALEHADAAGLAVPTLRAIRELIG